MENEESNTFVRVVLKQSSSSGKMGFDIVAQVGKPKSEVEMEKLPEELSKLASLALTTAKKIQGDL